MFVCVGVRGLIGGERDNYCYVKLHIYLPVFPSRLTPCTVQSTLCGIVLQRTRSSTVLHRGLEAWSPFFLAACLSWSRDIFSCVIQHCRTSGRNSSWSCSTEQKVCGRHYRWGSLCVPCTWCAVSWGTAPAEQIWMPSSCRLHYLCQTQSHPHFECCILVGTSRQPQIQWSDCTAQGTRCLQGRPRSDQNDPSWVVQAGCSARICPLHLESHQISQQQVFLQEVSSTVLFPSHILLPSISLEVGEILEWLRHWFHSGISSLQDGRS